MLQFKNSYRYMLALGFSALLLVSSACAHEEHSISDNKDGKKEESKEVSKIDIKKLSEALGNFIGRNLENPGIKFDLESVIKGIRDGSSGKASPMTEEEYEKALTLVQEAAFNEISERNLKAANDFLKENKKKTGVVEIEPEKLQYEVVTEGSGAVVEPSSKPLINYTGKFLDGTVFGSSQEAGGPIAISLEQTIPGFSKSLVGMKEGEKRKLYIHPDLGYGTTGQLPPNSLLIFDVEIVKANSADKGVSFNAPAADDVEEEAIEEIDLEEVPGKPVDKSSQSTKK